MKISLVIPMYNESSIIHEALETFSSYMADTFEDWELIFVDDGSADGCGDAVCVAHEKDERIRLCRYTPNRGKGYAVRTGVLAAQGDLILFTDCDNAYGTEALGTLAQTLAESDADIVVGSRNLSKDGYEGYTLLRKLASKTYIKVIAVAAGRHHTVALTKSGNILATGDNTYGQCTVADMSDIKTFSIEA